METHPPTRAPRLLNQSRRFSAAPQLSASSSSHIPGSARFKVRDLPRERRLPAARVESPRRVARHTTAPGPDRVPPLRRPSDPNIGSDLRPISASPTATPTSARPRHPPRPHRAPQRPLPRPTPTTAPTSAPTASNQSPTQQRPHRDPDPIRDPPYHSDPNLGPTAASPTSPTLPRDPDRARQRPPRPTTAPTSAPPRPQTPSQTVSALQ